VQPDTLTGLHQALRFGPGHCPPSLFEGSVPAIVRGLKVHANNIAHARNVALEETYPRLVGLMGLEEFHAAAEAFLERDGICSRALDRVGEGFEQLLDDAAHRNLARAEWAWLETFHAAEGEALTLAELAGLDPQTLIAGRAALHPAARWLALEDPYWLAWDNAMAGEGNVLLLTRPESEVLVRRVDEAAADVLSLLSKSCPAGDLLGTQPAMLIMLINAGAVMLEKLS
jgi:Putative DNA-binding domain